MPEELGAEHWRQRASEARKLADQMDDSEAKWRLLRIASDYEKLAEQSSRTTSRIHAVRSAES